MKVYVKMKVYIKRICLLLLPLMVLLLNACRTVEPM